LGFLHSEQFGKPSLVCDVQELYRYIIDDCVIQFGEGLRKRVFCSNISVHHVKPLGVIFLPF